jgi:N-methylhydantoinase B
MTNTMNTPVEALEMAYPFRVREYSIRRRTGGSGRHRGGDGLVRDYEFVAPADVTIVGERRRRAPYGARGGGQGTPGNDVLIEGASAPNSSPPAAPARAPRGRRRRQDLPSKATLSLQAGSRLRIETPGGGGWGSPRARG